MNFDVILGNPPYQMSGGGGGTNDTPLYNVFVDEAIKLNSLLHRHDSPVALDGRRPRAR